MRTLIHVHTSRVHTHNTPKTHTCTLTLHFETEPYNSYGDHTYTSIRPIIHTQTLSYFCILLIMILQVCPVCALQKSYGEPAEENIRTHLQMHLPRFGSSNACTSRSMFGNVFFYFCVYVRCVRALVCMCVYVCRHARVFVYACIVACVRACVSVYACDFVRARVLVSIYLRTGACYS